MDEDSLRTAIVDYKLQLQQVDQAISSSGTDVEELHKLRTDLKELISLTEGSLLSLKKSQLLASFNTGQVEDSQTAAKAAVGSRQKHSPGRKSNSVEKSGSGGGSGSSTCSGDDDSDECDDAQSISKSSSNASSAHGDESSDGNDTSDRSESSDDDNDPDAAAEAAIIGTCCKAPYSHEWGGLGYYAAAIIGLEGSCEESGEPKVRVMFLYPTQRSMVICPFYLSGTCRYGDGGECRLSHGEITKISSLREFTELAANGPLSVGDRCLARYDDGVWYKGVVVDVHRNDDGGEDAWQVMFDGYEKEEDTRVLASQHIIPLQDEHPDEPASLEESAGSSGIDCNDPRASENAPGTSNETPIAQPQDDSGGWEAHTRGIASKLMSKMGYVSGRGLGRDMQGRLEPVPILRLPKGKSLDKIMQLKERMGTVDAFDVLKQLQKRHGTPDQEGATSSKRPRHGVFDFLNRTFSGSKKVRPSSVEVKDRLKQNRVKEITRSELVKKSDRTLSVQLLKTDEEMKTIRRKITSIEQRISCNEGRDLLTTNKLREKLSEARAYLEKLECSEQIMQHHQKERQNRKKMTVF